MIPSSGPHSLRSPCQADRACPAKVLVHQEAPVDTDLPAEEATVHSLPAGHRLVPDAASLTAAPRPRSLVGKCLGDFEIMAELGRGGMGIVYKAWQKSLGRTVALKLLPHEHLHDSMRAARFLLEARAVAALKHPNIITVHQLGRCAAGQFLVFDYVEGPSLEDLTRKGLPPIPWTVTLLIVLAEAIHYAHTQGVLHRDLKPANILLERCRRPVIIDFGLAKFLHEDSALTQDGTIMGSPSYMAPEQAGQDLDQVGPASDVYSLGAILYMLLTGRAPYDEGSFLSTVLKVVAPEMPPSVRRLEPRVPAALEHICMKCLNKKPADRYPTARALADDLRRCRTHLARRHGE
ncbi:MAG TPA: serine/threonine-protein kinase [Gemmataceae bacterium]|nr:serine/threonine-protein kinase [Gemmataceae bacterium]